MLLRPEVEPRDDDDELVSNLEPGTTMRSKTKDKKERVLFNTFQKYFIFNQKWKY